MVRPRLTPLCPTPYLAADAGEALRRQLALPRRFALLAYLAVATRRVAQRRDPLVGLFWPEHDSEHARNALSQSLRFLRRWLGADLIPVPGPDEIVVNKE